MRAYIPQAIVISLLTLGALLTLFVGRRLDDNRLTSWQWAFSDADVGKVAAIALGAVALAYALSRTALLARHPLAVLALSSFAVGAVFWKEPEVIVDATRYFTQAKHFELYGPRYFLEEWGKGILAWTDLPLVPFLYGMIFRLAGEVRGAIQVFTTLLFSGTVVFTFLLGKALWDETVGFCAGALLLGMPSLLTQVPLMLADIPTMFFLTVAAFGLLRALERGGAGWIGLAAVSGASALLSKYSAWLLLLAVGILIVLPRVWREPERMVARAGLVLLAVAGLVGGVVALKSDVFARQLQLLMDYQVPGLSRWRESFASTFLFQVHPFVSVAAICSLPAAVRRRDSRYALAGGLVLLAVALGIERSRYLLPVFPMLALMAGYGLRLIRSSEIRRFAVWCTVTSSVGIAVFGYLPFLMALSAVNVKNAGDYLNAVGVETVEVFAFPQRESGINPAVSVPLLDLFTSGRILYEPAAVGGLPPGGIAESPLRFTWEQRNPRYYTPGSDKVPRKAAVVLIMSAAEQPLPEEVQARIVGLRLSKAFEISDGWFQYRTVVRVYEPTAKYEPAAKKGV